MREEAERLWRYNTYAFVREYNRKTVLPGPFMAIELIYRFVKTFRMSRTNDEFSKLHLAFFPIG